MRARRWALVALLLTGGALADQPKPEDLKKMYENAVAQLKVAQDRKNALAVQNEELSAKVTALTKEVEQLRAERAELKRRDAEIAEKTFFLRSHYAAWQNFIASDAALKVRWEKFMDDGLLALPTELREGMMFEFPVATTRD